MTARAALVGLATLAALLFALLAGAALPGAPRLAGAAELLEAREPDTMPAAPTGSIYEKRGRWYAKITIGPADRPAFLLTTCATEEAAIARRDVLATLATQLRAARIDRATCAKLLERAASRDGRELNQLLSIAQQLCRGELRVTPRPTAAPPALPARKGGPPAQLLAKPRRPPRGELTALAPGAPPTLAIIGVPIEHAPRAPGVYFIRQGDDGPIKIGVASHIRARVCSMQTANPRPLHFLGAVIGAGPDEEAALHARFGELREKGEWFRPGPELLAFIVSTHGAAQFLGA